MPTMRFFAARFDRADVLLWIFESGLFRVFETYSRPDSDLREFKTAAEAQTIAVQDTFSPGFSCWPLGAGVEPLIRRFALDPRHCAGATIRHQIDGWGSVGLNFGQDCGRSIEPSSIGVNSEVRAEAWQPVYGSPAPPAEWDWHVVQSSYSKLRYAISRRLATDKLGPAPLLVNARRRWLEAGSPALMTAVLVVAK